MTADAGAYREASRQARQSSAVPRW